MESTPDILFVLKQAAAIVCNHRLLILPSLELLHGDVGSERRQRKAVVVEKDAQAARFLSI